MPIRPPIGSRIGRGRLRREENARPRIKALLSELIHQAQGDDVATEELEEHHNAP